MENSQDAYQMGVARFQQGDLDGAMGFLVQVKKANKNEQALAMSYIGRIQTLRGEYEEAEKTLRRSLSMQATIDPQSLYFLGECYFYQRKWNEAEKYLRETIVREPKYTDAYIRLGMVLREAKRIDEAVRAFELAIVNDQKAVVARYQLAQICVDREDYKRALSQLHFVKDLAASYAPAFVLQGDIYQRLGDHRQSIVEYCKVVEMGKGDAGLYWRLGRSFMAIKDRLQAVKAFEQAIRMDKAMWPAYFYAAQLRDEFQHYEKAMQHYRALLAVEEYRAIAKEAIDRLLKHISNFDLTSDPEPIEENVKFDPPPVTTKVNATHTLEAVQRQLTSQIGGNRTAPLKAPTSIGKDHKWIEDDDEEEEDVASPAARYAAKYQGADVVDHVYAALRSGSFGEVVNVLKNSTMDEITGSIRSHLDPLLNSVKVPGALKGAINKISKKKGK
ncbi:MAG: tetratricopeptide repeat protein [Candidatus Sericytochromatia bacterium]|uniref:Tetratricopeptide repeat protein n=1 Tax=Candidatus Tanganyikabacteria bacterium TaxID=2961651 RepID=A0A938BNN6_9BACT|nr:tetratricopeptide repeat protein [Candidatus Tanganyikabacteria bacterium]